MDSKPTSRLQAFPWIETKPRLQALLERSPLRFDPGLKGFIRTDEDVSSPGSASFIPPFVQAVPASIPSAERYLEELPDELGLCVVLLIQAGATAIGVWRNDELLEHKAIKKYVVRGRGRAQPLHLKTRGKSRYGSRLRLQNAVRQLEETNRKLWDWTRTHGPFDRVYYSCPVRTWPELFRTKPAPPFEKRGLPIKIPLDVHLPDFAEVQRVWRELTWGRERT
jgi:hypothetical protein